MYVVMKTKITYNGSVRSVPHCLFDGDLKQANAFIKGLNKIAIKYTYWHKLVPVYTYEMETNEKQVLRNRKGKDSD